MSEKLLKELEKRLKAKTIHELRQIARAVGVPRPAGGKKARIIDGVLEIASAESDPSAPSVRGAHPKSNEYDRQLVSDIMRCRELILFSREGTQEGSTFLNVATSGADPFDFNAEGLLEKSDGKWFMRVNGCEENLVADVFVSEVFIERFGLREGDLISGRCNRQSLDETAGLVSVIYVNGFPASAILNRTSFESLTPVYPEKQLKTARDSEDVAGRMIDLLAPIGAGQRAVITGPHGAGKTFALKNTAIGIKQNNPQINLVILLIDARPEEVSDFRDTFPDAHLFLSSFDSGVNEHVRTARLALEYSKRQTEAGKDTVLVLDDITRLTRAYNFCGRQMTAGLDVNALDRAKRFLASARNLKEGASLTIISALNEEGDSLDSAIYSGLKDVFNMRVSLKLNLVRSCVRPPIDILNTCTLGGERLQSDTELKAQSVLREKYSDTQKALELFNGTSSNEELCKNLLNNGR